MQFDPRSFYRSSSFFYKSRCATSIIGNRGGKRLWHAVLLSLLPVVVDISIATGQSGSQAIQLASDPDLSPNGKLLSFSFAGDVWIVPTQGGLAHRISSHPAEESRPRFSPTGDRLAYISHRSGSPQVWIQSLNPAGRPVGTPSQVTYHTGGYQLESWYPDGKHLLVTISRDDYWYARENVRFAKIAIERRQADQILFDDYGGSPSLSSDGASVLFQREGVAWWRKGYHGTQAGQIWRFDVATDRFTKILHEPHGDRSPLWKPDGKGFYVISQRGGTFNIWDHDFDSPQAKQITHHDDDSVVMPTISADGSTLVYRHLFDFYRLSLNDVDAKPIKINIRVAGDPVIEPMIRRTIKSVEDATFTPDGLEMAFAAGGDIWVMDTELREPVNVTCSAVEESQPLFVDNGKAMLFLRDHEGAVNVWRCEPESTDLYWWQQTSFRLKQLTDFTETITNLRASPNGCKIGYVRKPGNLYVADIDAKEPSLVVSGFDAVSFDFSPDGRWIAYAQNDNDFNSDIWIVATDGSSPPVNVSRHPKNDYSPKWSPDGRILAFTGIRDSETTDLHYVYLKRDDADLTSRDRTLQKASKKIDDVRKKGAKETGSSSSKTEATDKQDKDADGSGEQSQSSEADQCDSVNEVLIDFEDIHKRVKRIRITNASAGNLFWFGEKQTLAFRTTIDGREGTYIVAFPDDVSPKFLTTNRGESVTRLMDGKTVGWVTDGTPATLGLDGTVKKFAFSARQEIDAHQRYRAGFDVAWRLMRDNWYDDRLGNRNWDAIRRKYTDAAGRSPDDATFTQLVQMMLGELNGSHLGFSPFGTPAFSPSGWAPQTGHIGVRFDRSHKGPGLKVRDVIVGGPADRQASRIYPKDTILSIDGVAVDPDFDLSEVLSGPLDRDLRLLVRSPSTDAVAVQRQADNARTEAEGYDDAKAEPAQERIVMLRPISYSDAQSLLYPMWEEANRRRVEELSGGRLGYLHIQGMNMPSLYEFERKLFEVGYNRDGLIIDVRGNGGGSTADRLLTALTQPRHAITVPRGGGMGYPQDRTVYATWHKPIIVLCNQNSFSNAEIFSHAIGVLKRGRIVGVQTAGGVISTGAATVMDLGTLRQPFRGWYSIKTGQDMELNGAKPDVVIWPMPGEMARGIDRVLERSVRMLARDVQHDLDRPKPELIKATERSERNKQSKPEKQ